MKEFVDRWKVKDPPTSLLSKIKEVGKSSDSLKGQIRAVNRRIDVQTKVLEEAGGRFQRRDAAIFNLIVKAMEDRDDARANILSTELAEIRKVEKMLSHASLALQSVSMRLCTISEMGDLAAALSPAKSVLNDVRFGISSVLPEASHELGNIGNLLSEIIGTTNQSASLPLEARAVNHEAEKILREAELAAEKKLDESLPKVSLGKNRQKVDLDS